MKPLTHYPRHPEAPDTYYIGGAWAPAAITAEEKRFSPGELAAEYWRAAHDTAHIVEGITWEGMCGEWSTSEYIALGRNETLNRFCTRPAHDDEPA